MQKDLIRDSYSEAPYNWPPPPVFFWAGEKVRLSEDGILFFRKYGTDVPLYDFSPQREGIDSAFLLVHKYGTDVPLYDFSPQREGIDSAFEYIPIDIRRWMRDRLTYPDPLDKVINPAYRNQILEIDFSFIAPFYSVGEWNTQFVKGYGIGDSKREILGTGNSLRFWNGLSPIAVRNDLKDLVLLFILSSGFLSSSFSGVFWYGFGFVLSRVYRQQPRRP